MISLLLAPHSEIFSCCPSWCVESAARISLTTSGESGVGPLETLLWVYPLLLLLNGFVAVALWIIYRKAIFGLLVGVWCSTLLNIAAQGVMLDSTLGTVLAFSSYIITAWFLCRILAWVAHQPFSFRSYWFIFGLALIVTVAIYVAGGNFAQLALATAVAVAAPQISYALQTLKNKQANTLVRIFAIVLLINGVHFIDYPFLRPIPEAAVFGYTLVIATSMLFGVLLPCIINNFLTDELTRQLRDEVANHQKTAHELEQALVITEQSSRAKTVFLANVSHHLRTPINGIMGLNDLLLATELTTNQQDLAHHVRSSSNELLNMVDNVLAISQLESGKVKVYPKAICIQQLVNDLFDHYSSCGSLNLQLVNHLNKSHQQWIYADALKIRQICLNLIDNALKHSEGSKVIINLHLDSSRSIFHIAVADDGVGMATERLTHLAQPFGRDVQSIHCGIGLGLSIVSELVALMSGQLKLDSSPGQGMHVECEIPVGLVTGESVAPSPAAEKASLIDTQRNLDAPQQATTKILTERDHTAPLALVVEDNPVNRMVISGMLKKLAVDFHMAEDGAQAMALYHQHKDNLACVLMDVQLPDANGLELVEKIRRGGDRVPVMVISAFTFGDDEAKAIKVGADAYLRKPYHFDEFKNALSDLGVAANA